MVINNLTLVQIQKSELALKLKESLSQLEDAQKEITGSQEKAANLKETLSINQRKYEKQMISLKDELQKAHDGVSEEFRKEISIGREQVSQITESLKCKQNEMELLITRIGEIKLELQEAKESAKTHQANYESLNSRLITAEQTLLHSQSENSQMKMLTDKQAEEIQEKEVDIRRFQKIFNIDWNYL